MEFVALLRSLWRLRAAVAVVAVLALAVGYSMAFRGGIPPTFESKQFHVGIARATALVDTPSSQVVDLGLEQGVDVGGLSGRASLLASVMTSSPVKDVIAKRAGVDPESLIAIGPSSDSASAPGVSGATISASDPDANVLHASVPMLEAGQIPIIVVDTQAPDAKQAARLADEAIGALKDHVQSIAGTDNVPDARRVVVRDLSPAHASTVVRGPGKAMPVVATIFVFLLGCAAILGIVWLVGAWRRLSTLYEMPDEPLAFSDVAPDKDDDSFDFLFTEKSAERQPELADTSDPRAS